MTSGSGPGPQSAGVLNPCCAREQRSTSQYRKPEHIPESSARPVSPSLTAPLTWCGSPGTRSWILRMHAATSMCFSRSCTVSGLGGEEGRAEAVASELQTTQSGETARELHTTQPAITKTIT